MKLNDIRSKYSGTQSHKKENHPRWKGGDKSKTPSDRYYSRNSEAVKESQKQYYKEIKYARTQEIRKNALLKVGKNKLWCSRCGCDEFRLLEINHVNGCGHKERKGIYRSGLNFWKHIISGERKCDDLNILCKACNILYYIKLNFGLDQYKIKWISRI